MGGPAFRPVAVGNSRYLARGAPVTAVGSAGLTKTFTLDIGNITSGEGVATAGGSPACWCPRCGSRRGRRLAALGNLSGQAIGISVAGTGTGLHHTGFAIPIDTALAVAQRIQAAHSH